jgi:alpha-tubulin suppressor-like RCC1 family protein
VSVALLGNNVVELAGGGEHTCALLGGGSVWCWGENGKGQLGTGTNNDSSIPVLVLLTGAVTAIAAGDDFTCAAVAGGGVKCWGDNGKGQLGDGTGVDRSLPVDTVGLAASAQSLAAGLKHACASFADGSLRCWGENSAGQLGDGTVSLSLVPTKALATGVQSVTAGQDFTCVTILADEVQCWGNDSQGQLGDGVAHVDSYFPVTVNPLPAGVLEVRSGQGHTCSLQISGAVYCWGQNSRGQLGNGLIGWSGSPVKVVGLP